MRRRRVRALLGLAAIVAVAAGIAIGAGGGDESLAGARSELIDNCANGDRQQVAVCRCLASELERKHGYREASQFERVDAQVRSGRDIPQAVHAGLQACARRAPAPAAP